MRALAGLLLASLALALAVGSTGCAPVSPWEREILARPEMAFDPDPMETKRSQHIYFSKEASLPGGGAGGGGCGCN